MRVAPDLDLARDLSGLLCRRRARLRPAGPDHRGHQRVEVGLAVGRGEYRP
jgi:hypothetical protein